MDNLTEIYDFLKKYINICDSRHIYASYKAMFIKLM